MSWFRFLRPRRKQPITLIAMRLADMLLVHPQQDNSRVCSKCGHQVGIYPSGQTVLAGEPNAVITCLVCAGPQDRMALAPGALEEPFQSQRREVP